MLVLGLETSCDDTSAAVVADGRRLLSNVFASQVAVHEPFGGVVPELASRSHLEALPGTVEKALADAGVRLEAIDGVAATYGPGLVASLLVGLMAAKGLAAGLGKPFVAVNHLQAHLLGCMLAEPDLEPPFLGLIVSGGHTALVRVEDVDRFVLVGQTRDDAAGEVLDKIGRQMGLGFPAGKNVEERARSGETGRVTLPRPYLGSELAFSFSGLKTAASLAVGSGRHRVEDVCTALQASLVDVLGRKCEQALDATGLRVLGLAGGVAANRALRERLAAVARSRSVRFVVPPPALCTDNAAMVAALGGLRLARGHTTPLCCQAVPALEIEAN